MRALPMHVLGFFAAWAIAGCGPVNELGGSIGQSYSLAFDEVQIRLQGGFLLIEYLNEVVGGTEKTCKIVVDTDGAHLGAGDALEGDAFRERVQISRVALTGGDFPKIERGRIGFEELSLRAGGPVTGEFEVVFAGDLGLHGKFAAAVTVVPVDGP